MTLAALLKQEKVKVIEKTNIGSNLVLVVNCGEAKATRIANRVRRELDCSATTGTKSAQGATLWLQGVEL